MLLTNLGVDSLGVLSVLEIYLTPWECEENYRFIKHGYNFEDMRALIYIGLRNMTVSLKALFYLIILRWGKKLKLNFFLKRIYRKRRGSLKYRIFANMSLMMGYRGYCLLRKQESHHIWAQKMLGPSCFCLLPFNSFENS